MVSVYSFLERVLGYTGCVCMTGVCVTAGAVGWFDCFVGMVRFIVDWMYGLHGRFAVVLIGVFVGWKW